MGHIWSFLRLVSVKTQFGRGNSLSMISILGEDFLGKKLYAAMAAMRFAANPPTLLRRVCAIWTLCFNSSFFASINDLFLSRILSRRWISEFFMFLRMRVTRWMSSTNNSSKRCCEMYPFPPCFRTNQKGCVAVVQMPPRVEEQRLLASSDRSRYDEVAMVQ